MIFYSSASHSSNAMLAASCLLSCCHAAIKSSASHLRCQIALPNKTKMQNCRQAVLLTEFLKVVPTTRLDKLSKFLTGCLFHQYKQFLKRWKTMLCFYHFKQNISFFTCSCYAAKFISWVNAYCFFNCCIIFWLYRN